MARAAAQDFSWKQFKVMLRVVVRASSTSTTPAWASATTGPSSVAAFSPPLARARARWRWASCFCWSRHVLHDGLHARRGGHHAVPGLQPLRGRAGGPHGAHGPLPGREHPLLCARPRLLPDAAHLGHDDHVGQARPLPRDVAARRPHPAAGGAGLPALRGRGAGDVGRRDGGVCAGGDCRQPGARDRVRAPHALLAPRARQGPLLARLRRAHHRAGPGHRRGQPVCLPGRRLASLASGAGGLLSGRCSRGRGGVLCPPSLLARSVVEGDTLAALGGLLGMLASVAVYAVILSVVARRWYFEGVQALQGAGGKRGRRVEGAELTQATRTRGSSFRPTSVATGRRWSACRCSSTSLS